MPCQGIEHLLRSTDPFAVAVLKQDWQETFFFKPHFLHKICLKDKQNIYQPFPSDNSPVSLRVLGHLGGEAWRRMGVVSPRCYLAQHRWPLWLCHGPAQDGRDHLGSISATLSLKMVLPWELFLLQQALLEELFVPLTLAINFKARRSHYGRPA